MDKIKGKYETMLGFAALIISWSEFKDELAQITLDLGFYKVRLSEYFLAVITGFSLCLYIYVSHNLLADTKAGRWKILDGFLQVAYFLFSFILASPLVLFTLYIVKIDGISFSPKGFLDVAIAFIGISIGLYFMWLIFSTLINSYVEMGKQSTIKHARNKLQDASDNLRRNYIWTSLNYSFEALHQMVSLKKASLGNDITNGDWTPTLGGLFQEPDVIRITYIHRQHFFPSQASKQCTINDAEYILNQVQFLLEKVA